MMPDAQSAASEAALLDDVFSSGRDRRADPAALKDDPPVEPTEPTTEPPANAEPVEDASKDDASGEPKPKGYRDPQSGRFVPLGELQTEREKRQEAQKGREDEARLRQQAEDNARRYEAELSDMRRRIQAQQTPPPEPPDPIMDPEGAYSHLQQQMAHQLLNQSLNISERMARRQHGNEAVNAAFQAANQAGMASAFLKSPDPYDDLVTWHKRATAMHRIGDPDAYEKRVRDEVRQQVLEELKAGKGQGSPGPQRFPGSLADATQSGPSGRAPVSDESILGSLFDTNRKRK